MSATVATKPNPLVADLLKKWQKSLAQFTVVDLRLEDERAEYLPKSPASTFMRLSIDAEWRCRGGRPRGGA